MKKNHLILAIAGVFVLVAILTNPNQDRHKEVIKTKLNTYMQKSMKENLTQTDNEMGTGRTSIWNDVWQGNN